MDICDHYLSIRNRHLGIRNRHLGTRHDSLSVRNRCLGIRNPYVGIDRQLSLKGVAKFTDCQQNRLDPHQRREGA
jgi:hypothetical protein